MILTQTPAVLKAQHISLRPLCASDLGQTLVWRNQPHIRKWFFDSQYLTWATHWQWFKSRPANDHTFIIVLNSTQQPIGQIALYNINGDEAELGRMMIGEPWAEGHGYAHQAVRLLVRTAFEQWGLETIRLSLKATNQAAFNLYHRCGFMLERWDNERITMRTVRRGS